MAKACPLRGFWFLLPPTGLSLRVLVPQPDLVMDDNLEVFFCDLCNASVPENDLGSGTAVRVKGKVIGGCCLTEVRGPETKPTVARVPVVPPGGHARSGLAGATIVLLIAVAGGVMFLDWRLSEEVSGLSSRVEALSGQGEEHQNRLRAVEGVMTSSTVDRDLGLVREAVAGLQKAVTDGDSGLRSRLEGAEARLDAVGSQLDGVAKTQNTHLASMQGLGRELRLLGEEVAALMAKPRTAPVEPTETSDEVPVELTPAVAEAGADLPPELSHHISKLSDPDPGTRFEAVDKLIQSGDSSVLPSLVAMTNDADPFVRRLTVEGLSDFKNPASVEALLTALADAEEFVRHAAYSSLRKLTGQSIAFDPGARKEDRRAGQKRWQDWWRKNKDTF